MSLSVNARRLQAKVDAEEKAAHMLEIEEYDAGKNTKRARQQMLRMAHYYHLLRHMGRGTEADDTRMGQYWGIANKKIQQAKEYDGKAREIAESRLIDEHTRAWNIAEYYYEKGSKILCQMMITLMDYILQEETGLSVLYSGKDKSSYFDLLDEITGLNDEYVSCYGFLCAYDFCTEKIADFLGIGEYRQLLKEHERIITNGLPGKVVETIGRLKEAAGEEKAEYLFAIRRAFTPEPPYSKEQLEQIYKEIINKDFNEDDVLAMTVFSSLVIKVDEVYEDYIKE